MYNSREFTVRKNKALNFVKKAGRFAKHHVVLCVAFLAAAVTCFLVPPDGEYLGYFDYKTLSCLFLTLAVVCALRNIKFFTILARRLVKLAGNLRLLAVTLVIITFIGSMLIANDMALITFLPIGYFALSVTGEEKHSAYIFILQNISANLGGMLTPFGNPQNLYLYSFFNIPTGEFTLIMLPPFLLAIALLLCCCLLLKPTPLLIKEEMQDTLPKKKTALYLVLFAISILIVFRVIPYLIGLIGITAVLLFVDRAALRAVDYPLLCTFVLFFIFAGNLSRVEAVQRFFASLLSKNTLLFPILSCQCISNVPSAILLSRFTTDYRSLLLGVNIGGTGTLISSLASLITFSEYKLLYPDKGGKYFALFTLMNLFFLTVMTLAALFVF